MAQFLRPDSDVATSSWAGTPTAAPNIWQNLDEATASNTDFAYSGNNPNGSGCELGLSNPAATPGSGTCTVRYRDAQLNGTALSGSGTAVQLDVQLVQGTTVIASSGVHTLAGSWTARSFTFAASVVTDWSDLRVRFVATGGGGSPSNRRGAGVSWIEVETPDAPASVDATATPGAGSATGQGAAPAVGTGGVEAAANLLTGAASASNASSIATSSITVTAGRPVIVWLEFTAVATQATASDIGVSGAGQTWSKLAAGSVEASPEFDFFHLWYSPATGGGTGPVTLTLPYAADSYAYTIFEIEPSAGATVAIGSADVSADGGEAASISDSTAAVGANDYQIALTALGDAYSAPTITDVAPRAGWTEIDQRVVNESVWVSAVHAQISPKGGETTSSASWNAATAHSRIVTVPLTVAAASGDAALTPGAGSASGAGASPTPTAAGATASGAGSATGQGQAPGVAAGADAAPGAGGAAASGSAPAVSAGSGAAPGAGSADGQGQAPSVSAGSNADLLPASGAASGQGADPAVSAGSGVAPTTGAASGEGSAPAVAAGGGADSQAGTGTAAGTGQAADLSADATASPGSGSADGQGQAPAISAGGGASIAPGAGSADGSGSAPGVSAGAAVAAGSGAAAGQGHVPSVSADGNVSLSPLAGAADGAGLDPSVTTAATSAPGSGTATGSGAAPSAEVAAEAQPGEGGATGAGSAPGIGAGADVLAGAGAGAGQGQAPAVVILGAATRGGFAATLIGARDFAAAVEAGVAFPSGRVLVRQYATAIDTNDHAGPIRVRAFGG
ncbi:hypothetical protein OEW28_18590 [Defluviimonas sp. WL0002]|uniref:Uncharacterized protein n=1 Tax=Albidovulum marisflavi TaxID=2984159 RepID=A0ABT2ZHV6_9RHOB|nr:hypothetical protein [Defluviimonas sp. WL0002]MCV2870625.1 hypothetical protein [Defluviimonas sp. WL0002]